MTTTKKVAKKKEVSKKTITTQRANKKTLPKRKVTITKKKITKPLVKKPAKPVKSSKKAPKIKKKGLMKRISLFPAPRTTMKLATLSKTRFPINIDTIAMKTARIGGLAILSVGAIFTLLFSQYIGSIPVSYQGIAAQAISSSYSYSTSSSTLNPTLTPTLNPTLTPTLNPTLTPTLNPTLTPTLNPTLTPTLNPTLTPTLNPTFSPLQSNVLVPNHSIVERYINKKPAVSFGVLASEPLSEVVTILINVKDADVVDVLLFQETYTSPIRLGRATQIQPNIWEYKWDTTQFRDTNYKIAADITNVYTAGTPYREADSKYLDVLNSAVPVEILHNTAITTQIVQFPVTIQAQATSTNSTDQITFTISVKNADSVAMYSLHTESQSKNLLGLATKVTGDQWKFVWDTKGYRTGEYSISTRIKNADISYIDGRTDVTVSKIDAQREPTFVLETPILNVNEENLPLTQESPSIDLIIPDTVLSADTIELKVSVPGAQFVELWALPEGSQTEKIIGLAKKEGGTADNWTLVWNTRQIPNGVYSLFARAQNSFGLYKSDSKKITITNRSFIQELTISQKEQQSAIEAARQIAVEFTQSFNGQIQNNSEQESIPNDLELQQESQYNELPDAIEVVASEDIEITNILQPYAQDIDSELQRLITAYRSNDKEVVARAEERIGKLKQEISKNIKTGDQSSELLQKIDSTLTQRIAERKERSQEFQNIVSQRVGGAVFKDSDMDGVSDFDEQTIYNTDPYSADTDNDGFTDGSEIIAGYNPLDSTREVAVVYESPKEQGVVRKDILSVDTIQGIVPEKPENDTDGVSAQAVITGRALPNSFVTLYIFSDPVVVTVKTDADGAWQYRFDKELEDGEHSVYVGITDNAGKIVAKSAAFRFVKEAQAFTPADALAAGAITTAPQDNSLLSGYMLYLILSISVVSIGLVLILLGLHLESRQPRRKNLLIADEES